MGLGTDNAYAELGLAPGASEAEVKVAWRRLASKWHPDRNPSAAAIGRMQRINEALDQIRRSGFAYVATTTSTQSTQPAQDAAHRPHERSHGFRESSEEAGDAHAGDHTATQARTVSRKLKLTLEEAAAGCVKSLRGKLVDRCESCESLGYRVLGHACPDCKGAGAKQRGWYGWLGAPITCAACSGDGIARHVCAACHGTGKLPAREYRVNVRIPHGVRDRDLLHVGARHARAGHAAVQLDLRVEVLPHPMFELDADGTIRCAVPVDGFVWIANRTIEVPTLAGMQRLPLSRDQLSYRLNGQGFPSERRGPSGDHVVTLLPTFPSQLSTDQNILIDQLVATSSGPGNTPASSRLSDWRQTLREWERTRTRRGT